MSNDKTEEIRLYINELDTKKFQKFLDNNGLLRVYLKSYMLIVDSKNDLFYIIKDSEIYILDTDSF